MTTGTISRQPEQLLEYARRYHALGWVLTRVQHGGKRPIDDGWQTATPPTAAAVEEWFSRGRFNIGLRTGAVSGGIVDLDIDAEALVPYVNALAPAWLRDCPRYARGDRPHLLLRRIRCRRTASTRSLGTRWWRCAVMATNRCCRRRFIPAAPSTAGLS